MTDTLPPMVCLNCFARSASILQPCAKCGSRRVAHVLFLIQQLGWHWRQMLEADNGKVH